jgi:hypothetical protein
MITEWMTFNLPRDTTVSADKLFWMSNKPAQWALYICTHISTYTCLYIWFLHMHQLKISVVNHEKYEYAQPQVPLAQSRHEPDTSHLQVQNCSVHRFFHTHVCRILMYVTQFGLSVDNIACSSICPIVWYLKYKWISTTLLLRIYKQNLLDEFNFTSFGAIYPTLYMNFTYKFRESH